MAPIFFFVLMISLLAEAFERSRISKTYFAFMISGCLVPLAVLLFVVVLDPSALKWLE